MAESTKVWVKTSALDRAILGKSSAAPKRSIPGAVVAGGGSADEDDGGGCNWGWARADVVEGTVKDGHALKIFIQDEDSQHDRATVDLPSSAVGDGDVVMANIYRDDDDDEGGGGGYYEEDDEDECGGYPEDLITLTHLHEPAVVHCLRKRYSYDKIYTATGPILLALNPFKNCKSLYSDGVMKKYWVRGETSMLLSGSANASSVDDDGGGEEKKNEQHEEELASLPPHVYGIADHSFRSMMTKLEEGGGGGGGGGRGRSKAGGAAGAGCDQAILVSGESGAGKTVTTKFIMQYLATLSQRTHQDSRGGRKKGGGSSARRRPGMEKEQSWKALPGSGDDVSVEKQVLQSNPILESFGNARTIRNDNSSRFGKFIEIQFTSKGSLVGASIETYLLEKVRLITQAEGERNYHIFYEILTGMEEDELSEYRLEEYNAEDFRMTSNSGTYDRRDGVEDYDTFQDLRGAMETMGFSESERKDVLGVTCAVLHFSNLTFNSISADESEIDRDNGHLEPVLDLFGVTADALNQALCYFSIQAGKEKHTRSLPKQKAEKGTEALIKATYGALFSFIVNRINQSITVKDAKKGKGGGPARGAVTKKAATIGVLDIFGFESFKVNSFEQLCINYCNEALQQQFNLFVLKNEQDEYEREGIQWSFISFPENQDVLDLIDKKGSGILNILDDQCRAPGTTDKTFANDIYQKCTGHPRFEANFRQVGARKFGVHHYAGPVEYDTDGFVEKNRDDLPKEATELLLSSSNGFVKVLAGILSPPDPPKVAGTPRSRKSAGARVTVGGQFSQQLKELRAKIDLTAPHYVRCLKPNDQLVPDHFDPVIIADQLRCAGVVEAVRVSRVGYPQRYAHSQFVNRYRILGLTELKKAQRGSRKVKPVVVLVNTIAAKIWEVEVAKGEVEASEGKKGDKPDLVAVGVQVGKTKVFLRRKAYDTLELLRQRKMSEAAVKMQAAARGYIEYREYGTVRKAVRTIQCAVRVRIAIRRTGVLRRHHRAKVIQTAWRRMVAHYHFACTLAMAKWIQRVQRGRTGRIRYERLNRERKAIVIERYWRRYYLAKLYGRKKDAALVLQCAVRCHFARGELRELRLAARNLAATANERDELRQAVADLKKEAAAASAKAATEAKRAAEAIAAIANSDDKAKVEELTKEVENLKKELETSQFEATKEAERAEAAAADAVQAQKAAETALSETQELKERLEATSREAEENKADLLGREEEIDKLKKDLDESRELLSKQEEAQKGSEGNAKELAHETNKLKKELEKAKWVASDATSDMEDFMRDRERLQKELTKTKEELEEAKAKEPATTVVRSAAPGEGSDDAKDEILTLKAEIADAERRAEENEARAKSAERDVAAARRRAEENERRAADAERRAKESARTAAVSAAPAAAAAALAERSASRELPRSPDAATNGGVASEAAAEEILILQDEVERLNRELTEARMSKNDNAGTNLDDAETPDGLIRRYDELRRLAESGMEKDLEIEQLKNEVVGLKEELDAVENGTVYQEEIDDLKNEIEDLREELDARPPLFDKDRGMPTSQFRQSLSMRFLGRGMEHDDGNNGGSADEHIQSLKNINEMLRKQVEQTRRECNDLKAKLREEAERSAKELEAFAETLRGVDELRKAAEAMSRELQQNKRMSRNEGDRMPSVREHGGPTAGTARMDEATRILDSRHGSERSEGSQQSWRFGSWGAGGGNQRAQDDSVNARKERSRRSRDGRRRRRRGSGDNSVMSNFF